MLRGAVLPGAYLTYSNLSESDLTGAVLIGVRLGHARFHGARIGHVDSRDAVLDATKMEGVRQIELAKNLSKATLGNAGVPDFDQVFRSRLTRWTDWEALGVFGRLPLFGASYTVLIMIPILTYILAFYNHKVTLVQKWAIAVEEQIVRSPESASDKAVAELAARAKALQKQPVPRLSMCLFTGTIFLAVASTLYWWRCPTRIREFSKDRWCDELNKPLILYWPLAWQERYVRYACAFCYSVGAILVGLVIVIKVGSAGLYIWQHGRFL